MPSHHPRCPLMGCVGGCGAPEDGAAPLVESGTIQDEQNNAAVAVGASMARAVLAAEHHRQTGELPPWATSPNDNER